MSTLIEKNGCYYLVNEEGKKVVVEYIQKHPSKEQWAVFSEKTGKRLSGWYSSKEAAQSRLREIEAFKHMKK